MDHQMQATCFSPFDWIQWQYSFKKKAKQPLFAENVMLMKTIPEPNPPDLFKEFEECQKSTWLPGECVRFTGT